MKQPRVKWTVAAIMLAVLLASLDQTIVATAMPTIVAELKGMDIYSWVFTAYMLTSTTVMPIVGKLSDLYGRKLFFLLGLAVFMAGSALAGTADSMMQLVLYRGLQGLGGGALMPVAFTIIFEVFPPEQRGKMQGLLGAVFGLSSVFGPTIGAYITEYMSWNWIFYINLPLGILSFVILLFALVETKAQGTRPKIDFLGAVAMAVSVVSFLLALVLGGKEYAWSSWQVLGLFGTSALFLILFLLIEQRVEEPMLPLALFRKRVITVMAVIVFMQGIAMMGSASYIPLFVQGVLGGTATNAGNILTPMMLAVVAGSMIGGFMMRKFTYRTITIAAMAVMSLGGLLLSQLDVNATQMQVILCMILLGLGVGPLMPVSTTAVQGVVDMKQRGVATSSIAFFRSIGGTVGVAIMGTIVTNHLTNQLADKLDRSPLADAFLQNPQALLQPELRVKIPPAILSVLQGTLAEAISYVFLFAFAAAVVGLVTAFFMGKSKLEAGKRKVPSQPVTEGTL